MRLTDINDIRALLARHGFRFSKSMGQNFLIAEWVPERIVSQAGIDGETGVLEVGPGLGCLTEKLALRAGKVVAIELDRALEPVLRETLAGCGNTEIVFGDALSLDLAALAAEKLAGLRPVVCANLPYNVASPLITAFLEAGCFEEITVMVQREAARRICAEPGCSDYGAFTVLVNWYAEPELLFDVPPSCFVPQPKVTSSVLRLRMREAPPAQVSDKELFFRVVRAAFALRRKTLLNALSAAFGEIGRENIQIALDQIGFNSKIRGETLSLGEFAKIANRFCGDSNKNL